MNAGGALALKLVLTPVLIGAASVAGRRWGAAIGGWLIGIPFTSGPIVLFLALDQGSGFAARAAAAVMAGAISQAVFCVAYAWAAQRWGWALSLLAAAGGFAAVTVVLTATVLSVQGSFVVIILVIVVSLFLMPHRPTRRPSRRPSRPAGDLPMNGEELATLPVMNGEELATLPVMNREELAAPITVIRFPWWDLPARMVVATAFVLVLTAIAPLLGARLAGLLAPFPLYGSVLAAFAQRIQGADAAAGVVRGLLLGLFAFSSFFLVLALLLTHGVVPAFASAIVVALVVHGASLLAGRRLGLA